MKKVEGGISLLARKKGDQLREIGILIFAFGKMWSAAACRRVLKVKNMFVFDASILGDETIASGSNRPVVAVTGTLLKLGQSI